MSRLTPEHVSNMTFDEKVAYLLNTDLVGDMPSYLSDTIRDVLLDFIEQVEDKNEPPKLLSVFECSTMREVKHFVLNTDLKDLNIPNTDRLFELKSKLKLDIMVLSDALEVLDNMKNAGNFVNKYFEEN